MTGDAGKYLEINAETGRVELVGATRELAFELHDGGYISLAPNRDWKELYSIQFSKGSATVTMSAGASEDMVGQYARITNDWSRITTYINETQMGIDQVMTNFGTVWTHIVTMNEIEIEGGTLTKLEIDFEPRVR